MRLAIGLIAAAVALSGCTASPLFDGMNRISLTDAAEPMPGNYKNLLRHYFGLNRPRDYQISAPRPLIADTVNGPARWYVCVRPPAGGESIHVISNRELSGTIPAPAPSLCDGGRYERLD